MQHYGGRSRSHSFAYAGVHHEPRDADPLPKRPSLFASLFNAPRREQSTTSMLSSSVSDGPSTPPQPIIELHEHDHHDEAKDSFGLDAPIFSRSFFNNRRSSWGPVENGLAQSPPTQTTPTRGGLSNWLGARSQDITPSTSPEQPSSIGLFRRFSLGSPIYKAPTGVSVQHFETAPVESIEQHTETEQRGRMFQRRTSSGRRLSPTSEKMLRDHFHHF